MFWTVGSWHSRTQSAKASPDYSRSAENLALRCYDCQKLAEARRTDPAGLRAGRGSVTPVDKVYGKHSVRAVLLSRPEAVTRLLLGGKESYHRDLIELARSAGVTPELVAWPEFRRLGGVTDDDKHQGAVALTTPRPLLTEGDEVLYSKYGGTEIKVDGEDLLVLRESDVLAKVQ